MTDAPDFFWSHTVHAPAAPTQVWPLYANIERWTDWDTGLRGVSLDGSFTVGTTGTLEVEGQPPLRFTLTDVVDGESFTDVTEIPGVASLTFGHHLRPVASGTEITHTVAITGPAAEHLGPAVTADTPEAMATLAALATP